MEKTKKVSYKFTEGAIKEFTPYQSGKISQNRKEKYFNTEFMAITSELKQVITCRFYTTPRRTYCCLWLNVSPFHSSGGSWTEGDWAEAFWFAALDAGFCFDSSLDKYGRDAAIHGLTAIMNLPLIKNAWQTTPSTTFKIFRANA